MHSAKINRSTYVYRSGESENLRDSGIDLLKVGIPKLSVDTRIEQPRSPIARAFKPRPLGKEAALPPRWTRTGNMEVTPSLIGQNMQQF